MQLKGVGEEGGEGREGDAKGERGGGGGQGGDGSQFKKKGGREDLEKRGEGGEPSI